MKFKVKFKVTFTSPIPAKSKVGHIVHGMTSPINSELTDAVTNGEPMAMSCTLY